MYIYIYIYIYTHTHTHIHIYVCVCVVYSLLKPRAPQVSSLADADCGDAPQVSGLKRTKDALQPLMNRYE